MKVIVVGAGAIGLSTAIELAGRGVDVVVLEPGAPGQEASAAAGGMLVPQTGLHEPGAFLDFCLAARERFERWTPRIEALARQSIGHVCSGALRLAWNSDERATLLGWVERYRAAGLDARWVDAEALLALEPGVSPAAVGAALFDREGRIDAQGLSHALVRAATSSGISFETGRVEAVLERGGVCLGVRFEGREIPGDWVVLAAGAWSGQVEGTGLPPRSVQPVRGQMVELCDVPAQRHVLFSSAGYLVPKDDRTVLVGSTMEHVGYDKGTTAEAIHRLLGGAMRTVPGLGGARVGRTWSGLRPCTADGMPILGTSPLARLVLATGHSREGILLAPLTADIVADLVMERPTPYDLTPYSWRRFSSP